MGDSVTSILVDVDLEPQKGIAKLSQQTSCDNLSLDGEYFFLFQDLLLKFLSAKFCHLRTKDFFPLF